MKKYLLAAALLIVISSSGIASAAPGTKTPLIQGRAYIYWQNDLSGNTADRFDINRLYLDLKHDLDADAAVRVTTDIARETYDQDSGSAADTRLHVYLKYAYVELNELDKRLPFIGLRTIRLGQSATHWIDFMQKYWQFRYVAKTLTDENSFFHSADMGLVFLGRIDLDRSLFYGDNSLSYQATLMNGEGYKEGELNPGKDVALRLAFSSRNEATGQQFTLAGGALIEDLRAFESVAPEPATKLTVMAAYQLPQPARLLLFIEYANQLSSPVGGTSLGGQIGLGPQLNLFVRVDRFRQVTGQQDLQVVGLEYPWGKDLKLALDYQREVHDGQAAAQLLSLHAQVNW
ncbi:MAG: hypothetical protein JW782_05335 [Candidatus Saganbacteria bacterium]|nr:hypothetical protein [Candidatus Saganbacteria bacterium]